MFIATIIGEIKMYYTANELTYGCNNIVNHYGISCQHLMIGCYEQMGIMIYFIVCTFSAVTYVIEWLRLIKCCR